MGRRKGGANWRVAVIDIHLVGGNQLSLSLAVFQAPRSYLFLGALLGKFLKRSLVEEAREVSVTITARERSIL
jgi:hypothetical protein